MEPIAAELEDDEAAQFHRTIASLLDGVKEPDKHGNREQLNSLLQGSEVHWCGTFDELVGGSTEFARAVRDAFWSNEDDEGFDDGGSERPIPAARLVDFVEFFAGYGF